MLVYYKADPSNVTNGGFPDSSDIGLMSQSVVKEYNRVTGCGMRSILSYLNEDGGIGNSSVPLAMLAHLLTPLKLKSGYLVAI